MIHEKDKEVEAELKQVQKEFEEQNDGFKKKDNPLFMDKSALLRLNERVKNQNKIREIRLMMQQTREAQEHLYKVCMNERVCPHCGGELKETDILTCYDCKKTFDIPITAEEKRAE